MARWKEIDMLLKICRMCIIQKEIDFKGLLHEECEVKKFEKTCDEIIVKCSKDVKLDENYFRELLLEDICTPKETFVAEFEELFGEEYEDILQPYIN